MKRFFVFALLFLNFAGTLFAELVPSKIYLLANSDDPESLTLANYYCEKRGVPAENIIAFKMPTRETINWREFVKIHDQFLAQLIEKKVLTKAIVLGKTDSAGRAVLLYSPLATIADAGLGQKVDCLILCRGVPLRIANEESLLAPAKLDDKGVPAKRAPLETTCASVDSEMALGVIPQAPVPGPVKNPYFKNDAVPEMQQLAIRVARLDGPTLDDAKRIVSRSIEAEQMGGPAGRAYVDKGGPYAQGNRWFEEVAGTLKNLGYDTTVDVGSAVLPQTARYDAPAFYFGWYTRYAKGFVEDPSFYFPAGAVAFHLHSFSATTLRDRKEWCAALIGRGAVATFGNVYEPFLDLSIFPHIVMSELAAGKQLGEAAFAGTPALSWQGVIIGDPLYRPFSADIKSQLYLQQMKAKIGAFPSAQYIFMRTINYARSCGDERKAEIVERELKLFAPGLAGKFFDAQKNTAAGTRSQWQGPNIVAMRSENVGLLLDVARWLANHQREQEAATIYGEVLLRSRDGILPKYRKQILEEAVQLVREKNLTGTRINVWLDELEKK